MQPLAAAQEVIGTSLHETSPVHAWAMLSHAQGAWQSAGMAVNTLQSKVPPSHTCGSYVHPFTPLQPGCVAQGVGVPLHPWQRPPEQVCCAAQSVSSVQSVRHPFGPHPYRPHIVGSQAQIPFEQTSPGSHPAADEHVVAQTSPMQAKPVHCPLPPVHAFPVHAPAWHAKPAAQSDDDEQTDKHVPLAHR